MELVILLYKNILEMMTSDQVLRQYDPKKPVAVAFDATPNGLVAVLVNIMPDGSENQLHLHQRPSAPLRRSICRLTRCEESKSPIHISLW